ncbi:unnamed protein product [Protopolystoma xenopodis]|uniref:Uncharacterized protein n=1 Tax=Protopolystoma xenopodis TaxID=117903 RepID=A0A3S5ACE4_9PLAT|nr:unnamed protein product [Protopolystoma xenopodis]
MLLRGLQRIAPHLGRTNLSAFSSSPNLFTPSRSVSSTSDTSRLHSSSSQTAGISGSMRKANSPSNHGECHYSPLPLICATQASPTTVESPPSSPPSIANRSSSQPHIPCTPGDATLIVPQLTCRSTSPPAILLPSTSSSSSSPLLPTCHYSIQPPSASNQATFSSASSLWLVKVDTDDKGIQQGANEYQLVGRLSPWSSGYVTPEAPGVSAASSTLTVTNMPDCIGRGNSLSGLKTATLSDHSLNRSNLMSSLLSPVPWIPIIPASSSLTFSTLDTSMRSASYQDLGSECKEKEPIILSEVGITIPSSHNAIYYHFYQF